MGRPGRVLTPEVSERHRFGAELRRWRLGRRLTQQGLGALVWQSPEILAKVEKGQRWPSADLAVRCDRVLGAGGALTALWPLVERQRLGCDGRRRLVDRGSRGVGEPPVECGDHVGDVV